MGVAVVTLPYLLPGGRTPATIRGFNLKKGMPPLGIFFKIVGIVFIVIAVMWITGWFGDEADD